MRNFESDTNSPVFGEQAPERYEAILTTTQRTVVARVCDILEDREVPVMIEHVVIFNASTEDQSESAAGYRVLVPSHFLQTAAAAVGIQGETQNSREVIAH